MGIEVHCVGMSELLTAATAISSGKLDGLTEAQRIRLLQLKVHYRGE